MTRDFIVQLKQEEQSLPPGPIIMSPDGAFTSFTREVIYKKPEIFKIAVLREIKQLFSISNPFYAGFGNRDTDALAYKAVGVNLNRIFLINPEGKVYGINNTYKKNYKILNDMVDSMFPFYCGNDEELLEKYNQNNYWSSSYNLDVDLSEYL